LASALGAVTDDQLIGGAAVGDMTALPVKLRDAIDYICEIKVSSKK